MRAEAVVLDAFEGPLREAERELPRPEPGAAVAEIIYAGVCGTDVHLRAGKMAIPTPVVLGHEAVGRIVAVGDALTEDAQGKPLREGDIVGWASSIACGTCRACLSDEVTLCERRRVYGINQSWSQWPHFTGGWASAIYLHEGTTIVRLPKSVDALEAIALGCAGPTVVHGLRQIEDVSRTEVIVQGSGPVGIAAALLARQRGARRVLMIGGPSQRMALVRDLGIADAYLDLEVVPEPRRRAERAREVLEDDEGAQVVIECTGVPDAVAEGIDLCRPGGAYLVLGQYTDRGPAQINPHRITRKQLSVAGSWAFSPADYLEYIQALPGLLPRADLKRLVQVFPLPEAERALDQVAAGRVLKAALAPVGVHAHG